MRHPGAVSARGVHAAGDDGLAYFNLSGITRPTGSVKTTAAGLEKVGEEQDWNFSALFFIC
jgi:hypothetical protein